MPRLTKSEKKWLSAKHPWLVLVERAKVSVIEGTLSFRRSFNGLLIEDSYKIRLEIPVGTAPPYMREVGGRLDKVLAAYPELTPADLHIYPSKRLCLAAPQELKLRYVPNPDIKTLFNKYIEPYFCWQSHYENNNQEEIWPQLSHNTKGLLEWYLDNPDLPGATKATAKEIISLANKGYSDAVRLVDKARQKDSFTPRNRCLCGGKSSYTVCHPSYSKLALALRG